LPDEARRFADVDKAFKRVRILSFSSVKWIFWSFYITFWFQNLKDLKKLIKNIKKLQIFIKILKA
jgi:hypothetical protein